MLIKTKKYKNQVIKANTTKLQLTIFCINQTNQPGELNIPA